MEFEEKMGKQRLADKVIRPMTTQNITPANFVVSARTPAYGAVVLGDYKGSAKFLDLDKLVNQPLILAEKQWTDDIVDTRNGYVKVTVRIGTKQGSSVSGTIEVSEGVWYLCCHEIKINQSASLTAGDIGVNFLVSSFPKVDAVDKAYYDVDNPKAYLTTGGAKVSGGGLVATQAEIAAGDVYDHKLVPAGVLLVDTTPTVIEADVMRDFRECDELNTELRLVAGDKLTLVATVYTADVAGALVDVELRVFGRVGKLLVS